jgi:predicted RNase H-like nuclease (RuvC/YqgF family)
MFGFKIISKRRYEFMMNRTTVLNMRLAERESEIEKLSSYNQELKDNCEELYNEVKRIEGELAKVGKEISDNKIDNLNELFIIKSDNYKCEKCAFESDDCAKLHFANQTICVTHKDNVNTFQKGKKDKK